MSSETLKMKVSRTFSLPTEVLFMVKQHAESNGLSDSEACRQLMSEGLKAITAKTHDRENCDVCKGVLHA